MITKQSNNSPIGIFDSGLGGLTVLKAIETILPGESFIYFGDTANLPYGTKSNNVIIDYSKRIMDFFIKHNTKAVVIACNTASAVAFNIIQKSYSIPVFDVVLPSVEYSLKITENNKIGIIGTTGTINSKAYSRTFSKMQNNCDVFEVACPLFVPIIEEGFSDHTIAKEVAKIYLEELIYKKIDTLILGCTHYSIMSETIKSVLPKNLQFVYSGETVANKLLKYLKQTEKQNIKCNSGNVNYFVTDFTQKFDEIASNFLGRKLYDVKQVDLQI